MPSTTITDIVLDQWIDLGANRCKSITATALSEAPVPPPVEEEDMPLNSAVYEPSRDFIYAVRGGRVFKLNATTGKKISEARFLAPSMDDTYVAYDSVTDHLWALHWRGFGSPTDGSTGAGLHYLVKIDPDDFATTLFNFDTGVTFGPTLPFFDDGPRQIVINNGFAFIMCSNNHELQDIYRINLSGTPAVTHQFLSVQGGAWGNLLIDGTVVWFCSNDGFNSIDARTLAALAAHSESVLLNGTTDRPYGIARNPGAAMYIVQATPTLLKGTPAAVPVLRTTIALGRPNATPFNIRYAAFNQRMYIPLWNDNTVAVLNPADDSFVIKSGFDSPHDVVVTNSKAFAVQQSPEGLREII